jgi:ABC-type transport system involved in multi-copper enzyme maturation permease subunit
MLWYKIWLEDRFRFLIAVVVMTAYCALIMPTLSLLPALHSPHTALSYVALINNNVYSNAPLLIFLVYSIVLGVRGLSRERSRATAWLTLALPVSRARLIAVSAAVGMVETSVLAMIPAISVIALSLALHHHYAVSQTLKFFALWLPCGAVCFSVALGISNLVREDHAAYATAIGLLILYFVFAMAPLHLPATVNLLRIMSGNGMPYSGPDLALTGDLPWALLSAFLSCAVGLIVISCRIVQRQDF